MKLIRGFAVAVLLLASLFVIAPSSVNADSTCDPSSKACITDCGLAVCGPVDGSASHARCMNEHNAECTACCHPAPRSDAMGGPNAHWICDGRVPDCERNGPGEPQKDSCDNAHGEGAIEDLARSNAKVDCQNTLYSRNQANYSCHDDSGLSCRSVSSQPVETAEPCDAAGRCYWGCKCEGTWHSWATKIALDEPEQEDNYDCAYSENRSSTTCADLLRTLTFACVAAHKAARPYLKSPPWAFMPKDIPTDACVPWRYP